MYKGQKKHHNRFRRFVECVCFVNNESVTVRAASTILSELTDYHPDFMNAFQTDFYKNLSSYLRKERNIAEDLARLVLEFYDPEKLKEYLRELCSDKDGELAEKKLQRLCDKLQEYYPDANKANVIELAAEEFKKMLDSVLLDSSVKDSQLSSALSVKEQAFRQEFIDKDRNKIGGILLELIEIVDSLIEWSISNFENPFPIYYEDRQMKTDTYENTPGIVERVFGIDPVELPYEANNKLKKLFSKNAELKDYCKFYSNFDLLNELQRTGEILDASDFLPKKTCESDSAFSERVDNYKCLLRECRGIVVKR